MKSIALFFLGWVIISVAASAQSIPGPATVRYDLFVADTLVNFTGKPRRAIAVNGQLPMPTLEFFEGDTAEIHVHNRLKVATSLHWHGLFLPNGADGVPYLTQLPIEPGETYVYRFPIIQTGTYWYHSHSGLQEQIGMYGALLLKKRAQPAPIPEIPLVISEWADMKPEEINRNLKNGSDYFALKKGAVQSYAEALKEGHFLTKLTNEWKRMHAMDVSDVYYDRFLVNGSPEKHYPAFKKGQKLRLKVINAGASSYFWIHYAGGKITVRASDGNDVVPVEVDRLLIAVSETYDLEVNLPDDRAYELKFTPEDRSGVASVWLGSGEKITAKPLPKLQYFEGMKMMNDMMDAKGNIVEMKGMRMQNQVMDMNKVMYRELATEKPVTLTYEMLRSPEPTNLPEGAFRDLHFELTGNMNRYVWTLNQKTVSETDKIPIRKGENLRIILYNNSMMRHPMHLHGHDFRIINRHGAHAPLKNVIDIMPMERDTLTFAANTSGDWFFHCHILYHMMSGMGRIFSYENSPPNPQIPHPEKALRQLYADDRMFHGMLENDFASNGNDGMMMWGNTRWNIGTEWRLGYHKEHGFEVETHVGRYVDKMQWLMPFVGFDWRYRKMKEGHEEKNIFGRKNTKDRRALFSAGLEYTLPMLIKARAEIYHNGDFRLQLMREDIPIASRVRMKLMWNTDKEYMGGLKYLVSRHLALASHYDSDMGWGAGFTLQY